MTTPNWDTVVTLAFAAEQACAAAQLLNNHAIKRPDALRLCYDKYVSALLQHTHFLPAAITARLERARAKYVRAAEASISREDARILTSELMAILRMISPVLRTEAAA
jgi:hypothetical protein